MKYRVACVAVLLLAFSSTSNAQFAWQKPVERDPAEVKRIVGPVGAREPSRDLNIVWVWGIDKLHAKETHEYAWVMDRYVNTLQASGDAPSRTVGLELKPPGRPVPRRSGRHTRSD